MELVQVEFEYEYTARNGNRVCIKPKERYILVSRTNDHWWHVQKDESTKPFYIPAKYVKELSRETQAPLDHTNHETQIYSTPQKTADRDPFNLTNRGPMLAVDTTILSMSKGPCARSLSSTHRMSTFGISQDVSDITHYERMKTMVGLQTTNNETRDIQPHLNRRSLAPGFSLASDALLQLPLTPVNDQFKQQNVKGRMKTLPTDPRGQSFLSQETAAPEMKSDKQHSVLKVLKGKGLSESLSSSQAPVQSQKTVDPASDPITVTDPSPTDQVQNNSAQNAVYVNVAELRRSISETPPLSSPTSATHQYQESQGWEVHTDQESGQEYYYHPVSGKTTWDNPLYFQMDPEVLAEENVCSSPSHSSKSPPLSSVSASPPAWSGDWEQCLDEGSGRAYFYNPASGESTWEPPCPYPSVMEPQSGYSPLEGGPPPPLPEEDYPAEDCPDLLEAEVPKPLENISSHSFPEDYVPSHVIRPVIPRASLDTSAPTGWNLNIDPDGTWVFTSEHSPDQWIKSLDEKGQTYYYLMDGTKSLWSLPEVGNGYEPEEVSTIQNWRQSMIPAGFSSNTEELKFFSGHRKNASDNGSDGSSADNSLETGQRHVQSLEKAGILNKTKVSENGKKIRKNWTQSWTVLHEGVLIFHKDSKSNSTGGSYKSNQIVQDVKVDLRGATIGIASKDKSSKKNVLELKKNGVEFLIQYDTESIIQDWYKVLGDTIQQLEQKTSQSDEDEGDISEKSLDRGDRSPGAVDKRQVSSRINTSNTSAGETDQKKVRTKLMKFLMKRPTLQAIKEKGYIRDNVFGCHLATLCEREESTVPSFVDKCIKAVEKRGLDMDGLYRVSGNLAIIQKLRFKADHEELDLEDGQWEDIHVITGALKLFFRELPEPLFPFSHFNHFIQAIRTVDYNQKVSYMRELVESLPAPNRDTMKLLFRHLRKVIECGEENRMSVQNVAIVFGPTLLRPEMESANIAMHMVFQNQIVELVLNKYEYIFHSS
ncbi:hypothetical protein UPYG_G00132940 [Umbra pygmaea]|uniref:Rho GTPase activating protein 27 n=1 Tax=Umbra pygmaea TaxID=75934 RepID=A0ABD0WXZ3_UMBPY